MGLSTELLPSASRDDRFSPRSFFERVRGTDAEAPGAIMPLLALLLIALVAGRSVAQPTEPAAYLERLDADPALMRTGEPIDEYVREFLVPLGAIQKIRGVWRPEKSERVTGQRLAYTWRVEEGFRAEEFVDALGERVAEDPDAAVVFSCDARACGSSVQWANRVFHERILYGTQESQRYRVYRLARGDSNYLLLVYGSARSSNRQYVRVELLAPGNDDQ